MRVPLISTIIPFLLATPTLAQYTKQSPPFRLMVLSSNSTYNGSVLGACHEGAGIEGLCPAGTIADQPEQYTTFYFNQSKNTGTTVDDGYLVWNLPFNSGNGTTTYASSATKLVYQPTSNVAVPIIQPGNQNAEFFVFDNSSHLAIEGYLDDNTNPPTRANVNYYNWFVCTTYYAYTYTTLAWVVGKYPVPQNPTCVKVDVVRVYT